jgi:pimeloyl-ACP methyl ester carboxylesterase
MFAEVNGIRLAYSDSGSGSPVVLLVHGFPLNRSMWDPQLGSLRAAGARVIAPDLRGFGASDDGPPGPLTMDQHADDLAGLLDALEIAEPVVFCGLSMGGYIGFAFWRRHQKRVRAMILADTRATPDTPDGQAGRLAMAAAAERAHSPQPAIDGMLPRMFSPSLRAGARPEQILLGIMRSASPRAVADGQRGLAMRPDSVPLLDEITVPILIIVGEHDAITPPAESELMHQRLPSARLVSIDQAGHMANLENPDAFNAALVAFVTSVATADRRAR